MGLRGRLAGLRRARSGGASDLVIGDPRFDDWAVVRDFEELGAARAWRQHLAEHGIEAVLTSDWPLDDFGRGDIALRVEGERWVEADELLAEP